MGRGGEVLPPQAGLWSPCAYAQCPPPALQIWHLDCVHWRVHSYPDSFQTDEDNTAPVLRKLVANRSVRNGLACIFKAAH